MTLVLAAKYYNNAYSMGVVFISDTLVYKKDCNLPPENTKKVRQLDVTLDCPKFALGLAGNYHNIDETFKDVGEFLDAKILEDGHEYAPNWLIHHLTERYCGFQRRLSHQIVAVHHTDHVELYVVNRNRRYGVDGCDYSGIGFYCPEIKSILNDNYMRGMNLEHVTHILQRAFAAGKKITELAIPPRDGIVTFDLDGKVAHVKLTRHTLKKIARRQGKALGTIDGYEHSVLTNVGLVQLI